MRPFTPRSIARRVLPALLLGGALLETAKVHGHGSFHERVEALTTSLRERPDDPTLLFQMAALNFEHGDWEMTLVQLTRIDEVAPGKVATDLLRGQALAAGGKLEAARTRLTAFLAAHPGHAVALAARAKVVSELGDPQQAAADSTAALAATRNPEPEDYFTTTNFLVAAGRSAEAVRVLDAGLAKLGQIPGLCERAIELELTLGHPDAAVARADARLTAAPEALRPPLMAARASVLARAGRPAEARAAWQALRECLATLPPLDRASHAMLRLAEQANQALTAASP
jgi:predicted Zn-dependent protease